MTLQWDDTIAALASPAGAARRGIVRLSGFSVGEVLDALFLGEDPAAWKAARLPQRHPGAFVLRQTAARLPGAVYLWPTQRSYTGQPLAELHTVGSPPLLEALLAACCEAGARLAGAGEFTLRAFLAGRIDLMQAEAVLGVIDAPDHEELGVALQQLAGGISGHIAEVRSDLLNLLADLEAGLDFVEDDIEFLDQKELIGRLGSAENALRSLLDQACERMQSTGHRRVVLAGLPNTGKSTLFNALTGRDAALVSEIHGTTRDYLSAEIDVGGLALQLIDTAGWEAVADGIEQAAQHLGGDQRAQADAVLWCTPADLDPSSQATDQALRSELQQQSRPVIPVRTKADLATEEPAELAREWLQVSATENRGLDRLLETLRRTLSEPQQGGRQLIGTTSARCRDSLRQSVHALAQARQGAEEGAGDEVIAIDVRTALEAIGSILGTVYTDDILDRIFSRFCIGK